MQGSIANVASAGGQGTILGDDGFSYTFTTLGWRDGSTVPYVGMRVDFEQRGPHAVGIYPVPGASQPPIPPVAPAPTVQQPINPVAPPMPIQQPPPPYVQQPPQAIPHNPGPPIQPYEPAQPPAPPAAPVQPQAQHTPSPAVSVQSSAPKSRSLDPGKIVGGVAVMFLLSSFLSLFLPVIGGMIGGFVGGRVSGSFANAAVAALISAVAIGGVTFLIVDFIVSLIESIPLIGSILMGMLGGILTAGAVILALLNALPMLIFALIGGATVKEKPDVSANVYQGPN